MGSGGNSSIGAQAKQSTHH
ncbi:hypothetical protein CCACVL1_15669 [Corchorus capsularis]|uniref:Uncharacterized protein n=1 Tax=Corchorus capsularis TaxID=210143 RepID=A0A1R3I1K5_COCAP|nr:hypothetical protein CCACVL1_15669 [Corchorus capsularis]